MNGRREENEAELELAGIRTKNEFKNFHIGWQEENEKKTAWKNCAYFNCTVLLESLRRHKQKREESFIV